MGYYLFNYVTLILLINDGGIFLTTNKSSISERIFYSKELNQEVKLLVYLPPAYSPLYKYHLLITQDGKDYFQMGRIGRVADELLNNHEMQDTIIVGIPYSDVEDRRAKYHPKGEQNKAYIRFLAHELIPYLDKEFSTIPMGLSRGLIGDSLGATVSLMAALKYPHTFGKVMLQSPLVNEDVLTSASSFSSYHLLEIFHIIGTDETEVHTTNGEIQDFLTPNRTLNELVKQTNADYIYEEFKGNHTWKYWQPYVKKMLHRMYSI